MTTLHEPFGRSQLPPGAAAPFDHAARVTAIGRFAQDVLAGRTPVHADAVFVAGALQAWLERGGNGNSLTRDFLKVVKKQSHWTPQALWRLHLSRERQEQKQKAAQFSSSPMKATEREIGES